MSDVKQSEYKIVKKITILTKSGLKKMNTQLADDDISKKRFEELLKSEHIEKGKVKKQEDKPVVTTTTTKPADTKK